MACVAPAWAPGCLSGRRGSRRRVPASQTSYTDTGLLPAASYPVPDKYLIYDVAADNGAVDNGAWNSWNGTLDLESPYVTASSTTFCPAQGWHFTLAGSHP